MASQSNKNSPKIGAGAVIIKNGKVLLAKRKGSHSEGMWGSMGGHLEFGESPIETAKREALEELGIEIGKIEFATCMSLNIKDKHFVDISFTAEIISGEPTIREPEKIEEIGWYPLDNLPSPLFEPVKVVIESIRTGRKYFEIKR
ncbi:MAG: NUDIX domain-containing protein [Parcubacteria group bacterium]|jgi:8-oxo-dGTP diphosphatase